MTIHLAEVKSLLELADRLDQEGKTDEAASLHIAAQKLVQAAAKDEEDEKEGGKLSAKQKAALKAFQNSAQRVSRVFGNRIPRSCKKLDDLAEQVIEACSTCDLD